jgi:choline dehydrogenase
LPPRISLNLFSESADMETAQRGVKLARMIYRTEPQARITGREIRPGPDIDSSDWPLTSALTGVSGVG